MQQRGALWSRPYPPAHLVYAQQNVKWLGHRGAQISVSQRVGESEWGWFGVIVWVQKSRAL